LNILADTGGGDQLLGQAGGFACSDHPPDRVAAEDIQDVVEVVVGPLGGSQQFRNMCDSQRSFQLLKGKIIQIRNCP
jgi:hypothetical protein